MYDIYSDMLRSYWFPVGHVKDFAHNHIKRVQVFGDSLIIGINDFGEIIAAHEACPHRGASLAEGYIEGSAFVCPYHGKKVFCKKVDTHSIRNEFLSRVQTRVAGDLVFICLNGNFTPDFPYFDVLSAVDKEETGYDARFAIINCSWHFAVENTLDPSHLEFLHSQGRLKRGVTDKLKVSFKHQEIVSFEPTETGIIKRRRTKIQSAEAEDWIVGQSFYFPTTFSISSPGFRELHFRTPICDDKTLYIWYRVNDGVRDRSWYPTPITRIDSIVVPDCLDAEDVMVLEAQQRLIGSKEHLHSPDDDGIILYRLMLKEQLQKWASRELPMGVSFSGEDNIISIPKRRETVRVVEDLSKARMEID